jgi:hypothetical protein
MIEKIRMLFDAINSISLPMLGLVLLLAFVAVAEIGWLVGRRVRAHNADTDANSMASAALGLLALLIAFTYSMSVARYDQRRSLVLQEANAIGTSVNFARMLPAADQDATLDLLRQYTHVRLDLGLPYDDAKMANDVARSNDLLNRLWQRAIAENGLAPQSLPMYRYIASLNETTNIAESRLTGLRRHVPVEILLMLAGTALIAMGFTGYAAGIDGARRQVPMVIMSLLLAFLIVVTQDIARPDRGSIEVSTRPLQDALAAIPPAPTPQAP